MSNPAETSVALPPLPLPPRRAPRPSGAPLLGNLVELVRDPLNTPVRWREQYGDVVRVQVPGLTVIFLAHPDAIETVLTRDARKYKKDVFTRGLDDMLGNGLVTSEGDFWKRQRRLVNPAFDKDSIRRYADDMVRLTTHMLDGWGEREALDVHEAMMRLTLVIVGRTLFGADLDGRASVVGPAIAELMEHYNGLLGSGIRIPWCLPTPSNVRAKRALRRVDEVVLELIRERRALRAEERHHDLLSALVAATDEDGGGMSDRELRDEAITLLMAGHETTAVALTMTWFLLSQDPRVEARLAEELERELGGRAPTFEDLPRLAYTRDVVTEAMRVYPPVWSIGREALEDTEVGGYEVHRGAQVFMYQWGVHRDPRFFDEPERFRPERWSDGLAGRLPKFAYFPFGGGPRACVGKRFAMMEAVLLVATIAQRYALRLEPGQELDLMPSITLRPRHGLRMVATRTGRAAGIARS